MFYCVKADGPEKEAPPAPTKNQPVQEKAAAVPPAKAAVVEVTTSTPVKLLTIVIQSTFTAHVLACRIHVNIILVTFSSPNWRNQ